MPDGDPRNGRYAGNGGDITRRYRVYLNAPPCLLLGHVDTFPASGRGRSASILNSALRLPAPAGKFLSSSSFGMVASAHATVVE